MCVLKKNFHILSYFIFFFVVFQSPDIVTFTIQFTGNRNSAVDNRILLFFQLVVGSDANAAAGPSLEIGVYGNAITQPNQTTSWIYVLPPTPLSAC